MSVPNRVRLEDLLLRHGAITQEQLQKAKEEQKNWGGDLGRTFVELGYISEDMLMRALAHQLGVPFVDPATEQLDSEIVRTLGVQLCEQYDVIAVGGDLKRKVLKVAMADPANAKLREEIAKLSGYKIDPCVATQGSIGAAVRRYYYGDAVPRPKAGLAAEGFPVSQAAAAVAPAKQVKAAQIPQTFTPVPAPAPRAIPTASSIAAAVAHVSQGPSSAELDALVTRISRLESYLAAVRQDLSKDITSNPQIAGLTARLEALEQASANDVGSLKAVVALLVERGAFKLEDLAAKVKQVREKQHPSGSHPSISKG